MIIISIIYENCQHVERLSKNVRESLPTSSARMMLVSLEGCVDRAWRTALLEQALPGSSSTAWMLATSGLVEDLTAPEVKGHTLRNHVIHTHTHTGITTTTTTCFFLITDQLHVWPSPCGPACPVSLYLSLTICSSPRLFPT